LAPLYKQYKLTPLGEQQLTLVGNTKKSGFYFNTYATPIVVGENNYMAFYVMASENEFSPETQS